MPDYIAAVGEPLDLHTIARYCCTYDKQANKSHFSRDLFRILQQYKSDKCVIFYLFL